MTWVAADAVSIMREVRRIGRDGQIRVISTADPLNLTGIVTAGERVRAAVRARVAYRDGTAIAVFESGRVRALTALDGGQMADVTQALTATRSQRRGMARHLHAHETRTVPSDLRARIPSA